jgi:long-subunit acyl-CoA synthetase (AMP-forming)
MPFLSTSRPPIPTKDILSWSLDDFQHDEDEPIYVDAADTSKSYSHKQAKEAVRKIAAGLRALGLKAGDTACIHSFNSVNFSTIAAVYQTNTVIGTLSYRSKWNYCRWMYILGYKSRVHVLRTHARRQNCKSNCLYR